MSLYLLLLLVVAVFITVKYFKKSAVKKNLSSLIAEGAQIIDVRSTEEFAAGNNPMSINIPLNQLENKMRSLDKNKNIILCCASGMRSGKAAMMIKKHGFDKVFNAGAWTNTILSK